MAENPTIGQPRTCSGCQGKMTYAQGYYFCELCDRVVACFGSKPPADNSNRDGDIFKGTGLELTGRQRREMRIRKLERKSVAMTRLLLKKEISGQEHRKEQRSIEDKIRIIELMALLQAQSKAYLEKQQRDARNKAIAEREKVAKK